ncbi:MAG: hypothetical protein ACRDLD_09930, partial [Thermoleophilaceae bacterium]
PPGGRDRRAPRIRVRGVPRPCARSSFRMRVRIRDRSRLRRARVALGSRRLKGTRRKSFRVRVPGRRMRSGRHRIRIRAVDVHGNRARRVVRFRRCARPAGTISLTG